MGKVSTEFTMSLDGFIAGPEDDVGRLMRWYRAGDTEFAVPGSMTFKIGRASADLLSAAWGQMGAIVTGRRDFDVSNAWGGQAPFNVPTFIVTHQPPAAWVGLSSPFQFVTEGVEAAVARAQQAAGDKTVAVSGTQVVHQALRAGLIDEIQIDLVPMLLGEGIRLFDRLGPPPIDLEIVDVIEGVGVTHLLYRVVR